MEIRVIVRIHSRFTAPPIHWSCYGIYSQLKSFSVKSVSSVVEFVCGCPAASGSRCVAVRPPPHPV
jgi:hypothetical protein